MKELRSDKWILSLPVEKVDRYILLSSTMRTNDGGSPLYHLNKYTTNIPKVYIKDENNNAKNSNIFFYTEDDEW